ncbi:MAG: hypothetical protein ACRCW0_03820 [Clostridium sp.]
MERYLFAGICYNIIICKPDLEIHNVDLEKIQYELDKKTDLNFYTKKESDKVILYTLKDEILLDEFKEFIKSQIELHGLQEDEIEEFLLKLQSVEVTNDILNLAKDERTLEIGYESALEHLYLDEECDIRICYECISFLKEAFIFEGRKSFSNYIENLIKKSARYNKISGTIRVFVE